MFISANKLGRELTEGGKSLKSIIHLHILIN
jgi:hypothetical protein